MGQTGKYCNRDTDREVILAGNICTHFLDKVAFALVSIDGQDLEIRKGMQGGRNSSNKGVEVGTVQSAFRACDQSLVLLCAWEPCLALLCPLLHLHWWANRFLILGRAAAADMFDPGLQLRHNMCPPKPAC